MKRRVLMAVLLAVSLVAAACGDDDEAESSASESETPAEGSGGTYTFGYLDALSGQAVGNTSQQMAGVRAYFQMVNDAGGVNGRTLELRDTDDGRDVGRAVAAFRDFARDEKVLGVLGGQLPDTLAAVGPLAGREELLYYAYSYAPALMEPVQPWVFNVDLSIPGQVKGILSEIERLKTTDVPKVAFFTVETPASVQVEEVLKGDDGIEVAVTQKVALDATDVSVQAAAIANAEPDFVALYGPEPFMILAMTGLRQRGVEAPAITGTASSRETTFQALAEQQAVENYHALRYGVMASDVDEPAAETMRAAAEAINWEEGLGGLPFTGGWMQGLTLVKALEECGEDCDRAGLREALEGLGEIDADGVMEGATLTPEKHSLGTTGRFYVWDDAAGHTVPADDAWVPLVDE